MLLFQGDDGSFMVNWPFVWPATNAGVEAGTLDGSLLDGHRLGTLPAR